MMYTNFLRKLVRAMRQMAGHCDGGSGNTGHCY